MKRRISLRINSHPIVRALVCSVAVFAVGIPPSAVAQIKCVDAKGRTTYSDVPCAANSKQQALQLGLQTPTREQFPQTGDQVLDDLLKSEKRLKWEVQSAESDLRTTTNPAYIPGAQRKLNTVRDQLDSVQMRMLAILDPQAYQREMTRRRQLDQDQRLQKAERDAANALVRANQAEQRAAQAEAEAGDASEAAWTMARRAPVQQQARQAPAIDNRPWHCNLSNGWCDR